MGFPDGLPTISNAAPAVSSSAGIVLFQSDWPAYPKGDVSLYLNTEAPFII